MTSKEAGPGSRKGPENEAVRQARLAGDYVALRAMGRKGNQVQAEKRRKQKGVEASTPEEMEAPSEPPPFMPEEPAVKKEWRPTEKNVNEALTMMKQRHGDPDD